jgi:hypothetical protein
MDLTPKQAESLAILLSMGFGDESKCRKALLKTSINCSISIKLSLYQVINL